MSHVISMTRAGDPRKTAVNNLSKVTMSGDVEVQTTELLSHSGLEDMIKTNVTREPQNLLS